MNHQFTEWVIHYLGMSKTHSNASVRVFLQCSFWLQCSIRPVFLKIGLNKHLWLQPSLTCPTATLIVPGSSWSNAQKVSLCCRPPTFIDAPSSHYSYFAAGWFAITLCFGVLYSPTTILLVPGTFSFKATNEIWCVHPIIFIIAPLSHSYCDLRL